MSENNGVKKTTKTYSIGNDGEAKALLDKLSLEWNKDGWTYIDLRSFLAYCRREDLEVLATKRNYKFGEHEHTTLTLEVVFEEG